MSCQVVLIVYYDIKDLQRSIEVKRGQMRSLNFPDINFFRIDMLFKVVWGADFESDIHFTYTVYVEIRSW